MTRQFHLAKQELQLLFWVIMSGVNTGYFINPFVYNNLAI